MSGFAETASEAAPERRAFIKGGLGAAGFVAASSVLAACGDDSDGEDSAPPVADAAPAGSQEPEIAWDMAVSWPTTLVTLFGSAQFFADAVGELTGGRFKINPRPAGELVGGMDVLPAVRDRKVAIGQAPSYYHVEPNPVELFGTAVPFGLTQRQQNAWLYHGGGLDMLNEFYAEEYGIITFPSGGTGCQMGGWFTKEIDTVDDLRGLRIRMPGLAASVFEKLGAVPLSLTASEILPAIRNGDIDAAEFTGPADDLALGLDEFGGDLYYYYPGWWGPGSTMDVLITLDRWNELPQRYQSAVKTAAMAGVVDLVADYDARNALSLSEIKEFAHLREFSPELMATFKQTTESELDRIAEEDERFAATLRQWRQFRDAIAEWHSLAERSYLSQQHASA